MPIPEPLDRDVLVREAASAAQDRYERAGGPGVDDMDDMALYHAGAGLDHLVQTGYDPLVHGQGRVRDALAAFAVAALAGRDPRSDRAFVEAAASWRRQAALDKHKRFPAAE